MGKHQPEIEKLISKLCPKGVEFRKLEDVVNVLDNQRKPISKSQRRTGKYPYYGANGIQDYVDDYIFDGTFLLLGEDGSVIKKDGSPVLNWATGKIWVNNHAHILSEKIDAAVLRYVFFVLQTIDVTKYVKGNIPKITQQNLRGLLIPVPPLGVQKEIVKILDTFTQLEAELAAELEARRKQYEHYRSQLLTFDDVGGVRWTTLGEIGTMVRGNGLQKKDFTETGVGCIHYGQIYTYYGTFADKTKSFVSPELAKKLKKAQKGNLVISSTSENVDDVCKAVAWLGDEDVAVSGDAYIYKHNQNPKFISYFFQTEMFFEQKKKYTTGTKVIRVSGDNMSKIKISLPSLDEQNRIVKILDKFDALINDISVGLPAELNARRKQYEYYRNKLLTFNEYVK